MFWDDREGGSEAVPERVELPTGVFTDLTQCYSTTCREGEPCYSFACPRKGPFITPSAPAPEVPKTSVRLACDYAPPLLMFVLVRGVA